MDAGEDAGDDAVVERFRPTSGRVTGIAGLAAGALILAFGIHGMTQGDYHAPVLAVLGALLGMVLVWAALLRPAVWVTSRELVMRAMFHTDRIPLAAIERVVVTQVLAVTAGGRRFVSPVVGYSARQTVRARYRVDERAQRQYAAQTPTAASVTPRHQELVETRIAHLAQDARDRQGIRKGSPEQQQLAAGVRREWAWPILAAAAVLALAVVVWLIVR